MAYYVDYRLADGHGTVLDEGRLANKTRLTINNNLSLVITEIGNDGYCCMSLRHAVNNHELNIGRRKFLDVDIDYCPWCGTSLDDVKEDK